MFDPDSVRTFSQRAKVRTEARKPLVVKIGGSTLGSHDTTLEDLVALQRRGILSVVIHGGAKKVTAWLERQGVTSTFVNGLRVTDGDSLEMVAAVLGGLVNTELVADINSLGGRAIGMTGVDGNLIISKIENPDLGYVGRIIRVNPQVVETVLRGGFIPVIAPPCAKAPGKTRQVSYLNVNGDEMAGEIAAAIGADRLVFLTDVEGIRDSEGQLISKLTGAQVKSLMACGVISGGMIPKADAALKALKTTPLVQIIDGRLPHALLGALEGKASGTTIY
ncbi:MAG: acetylglutamate kinase [Dehalococcoidia bacterium]|nr:acetylglutamate kinase [Dehalococcoidia bacterium]